MNQYIVIWHELIVLVNHDYSLDYVYREWNWIKRVNGHLKHYNSSSKIWLKNYEVYLISNIFYRNYVQYILNWVKQNNIKYDIAFFFSYEWHVDTFIMLNLIVIHVTLDIDLRIQILQTWFMQPINLTALLIFLYFHTSNYLVFVI